MELWRVVVLECPLITVVSLLCCFHGERGKFYRINLRPSLSRVRPFNETTHHCPAHRRRIGFEDAQHILIVLKHQIQLVEPSPSRSWAESGVRSSRGSIKNVRGMGSSWQGLRITAFTCIFLPKRPKLPHVVSFSPFYLCCRTFHIYTHKGHLFHPHQRPIPAHNDPTLRSLLTEILSMKLVNMWQMFPMTARSHPFHHIMNRSHPGDTGDMREL